LQKDLERIAFLSLSQTSFVHRFTLRAACKYHLLPEGKATLEDLSKLNNFSDAVVEIRECDQDFDEDLLLGQATVEVHKGFYSRCCDQDDGIIR